jgi:hypothetical protein
LKEPASRFRISVELAEKSFSVSPDAAIVGTNGIFLSGIQIPARTTVVVRIRKGPAKLALRGIVCAYCGELGTAVQFHALAAAESQALADMFAPGAALPRRSVAHVEEPKPWVVATHGRRGE